MARIGLPVRFAARFRPPLPPR